MPTRGKRYLKAAETVGNGALRDVAEAAEREKEESDG